MTTAPDPDPTHPDHRPARVRPSAAPVGGGPPLVVDCDACRMRDTDACADCVVGVLFTEGPLSLSPVEQEAIDALAEVGLVPRLRLVDGG